MVESQAAILLKMLEPAIRPNGIGPSSTPVKLPIEQQSFDAILEQAKQVQEKLDRLEQLTTGGGEQTVAVTDEASEVEKGGRGGKGGKGGGIPGLGGIGGSGGTENASLIRLLGQAGQKE